MALTQVKGSAFPDEQTLQPGMVMMWAGAENQIPTGWQLCNGVGTTSNGIAIPDLMDRMVIGSGSIYNTGDIGGATSGTTSSSGGHSHSVSVSSAGSHSHTVTVNGTTLSEAQIASHPHIVTGNMCGGSLGAGWIYQYLIAGGDVQNGASPKTVPNAGGSGSHTHTASTNSTGSHSHTANSANAGSHTHTVNTLSPYYALAFIIKL